MGTCNCPSGLTGEACQYSLCPRACSDNGRCLPLAALSRALGTTPVPGGYTGSDVVNATLAGTPLLHHYGWARGLEYAGWERSTLHACLCDPGYVGADCSTAVCPRGTDPTTAAGQQLKAYRLTITAPTAATLQEGASGSIALAAAGLSTGPFSIFSTPAALAAALQRLPLIGGASVVSTTGPSAGGVLAPGESISAIFIVTSWRTADAAYFPTSTFSGAPPPTAFFCDTSGTLQGVAAYANASSSSSQLLQPRPSFQLRMEPDAASFRWRTAPPLDGSAPPGEWSADPTRISAGGNVNALPGGVSLVFSPTSPRSPGEMLTVVVTGGAYSAGAAAAGAGVPAPPPPVQPLPAPLSSPTLPAR